MHPAKWEMVEAGGRTAQSFGLNRLLGRIYVYLYLCSDPQSLDAMAAELGVSKASVSIACRQLESWGAVRREWKKGDRKDYYVAETDLGRIIDNGLLASLSKKLDSAKVQIERSLELIAGQGGDSEEVEFLRARLQEAEKYRARFAGLLENPLLRRIL